MKAEWNDWKWQQKNSITDLNKFGESFKNINPDYFKKLKEETKNIRFQITPYLLKIIPKDLNEENLLKDPIAGQFVPLGPIYKEGHDAYDGTDNWENPKEFPNPLIHHKYTDRILIRLKDCMAYCNFCFEALRTLDKSTNKKSPLSEIKTIGEYIEKTKGLREVIISGGEPLLLGSSKLEEILKTIRDAKNHTTNQRVSFVRIHTRALTINPFRLLDPDFVRLNKDYNVNTIIFDVAHPAELTDEAIYCLKHFKSQMGEFQPVFKSHTPLLRGINNNKDTLLELFTKLYENRISPHYLLHSMPHTLFADKQRIPVRDGVELMRSMKRHVSNVILPEYIFPHYDGKHTIPLEPEGTPEFQYVADSSGNPYIKFLNWKNEWVLYPDAK